MRTIGQLEYLEGLVKLARRRKDEEVGKNQVVTITNTPVVKRISANTNYKSKTMRLLTEINNGMIERLVDTGAFMLVMAASIIQKLGIMQMVS